MDSKKRMQVAGVVVTLVLLASLGAASAAAVHVSIWYDGVLHIDPNPVRVKPGDALTWDANRSCDGVCDTLTAEYEIVISPPLGPWSSGRVSIPDWTGVFVIPPAPPGLYKYTINFYNGGADPCFVLDPHIEISEAAGLTPYTWGLIVLLLVIIAAAAWALRRRKRVSAQNRRRSPEK